MRQRDAWGIVSLANSIMGQDGSFHHAVFGYCVVVTDKEFGADFRSTEKWQLLVFQTEDTSGVPVVLIPGCNVKGFVAMDPGTPPPGNLLDATQR